MRSPLKKLMAVVVPVFVALAVMASSASAFSIVPVRSCSKKNMEPTAIYLAAGDMDANGNGFVCVKANGNQKQIQDDEISYQVRP